MSRNTVKTWLKGSGDEQPQYAKMTTALLDCLTHHGLIVETGNESYRFRHNSREAKSRIKSREQSRKATVQQATQPSEGEEPF